MINLNKIYKHNPTFNNSNNNNHHTSPRRIGDWLVVAQHSWIQGQLLVDLAPLPSVFHHGLELTFSLAIYASQMGQEPSLPMTELTSPTIVNFLRINFFPGENIRYCPHQFFGLYPDSFLLEMRVIKMIN